MSSQNYPLLCLNPDCRPDEFGGPRQTNRHWFCPPCLDHAKEQLIELATFWDDLEDALGSGEVSFDEQGRSKRSMVTGGITVNEAAATARRQAIELVWFLVRVALDKADSEGKTLKLPADQRTPSLARWVADWRLDGLIRWSGEMTAKTIIENVRTARNTIRRAVNPNRGRKIQTGLRCEQWGTDDQGARVPCQGLMSAWITPQMTSQPDLVCDADPEHRVEPVIWQRAGWKRAHASLNVEAATRLARVLTNGAKGA